MTSPDLSAYVDLRIYDLSDQEIVDAALAALKLNIPGWIPREGNTEVMLLESLALETAETIVAINRLPGAVVQAVMLLAGVSRDYGAAPTATATITVGDANGYTIPGGTRLYLPMEDGSTVTFLIEPPGLTIAAGQTSGTCSIIGDAFTADANGTPSGTRMVMADPVPYIDTVTLASAVADGRSPETDEQWRDRGVKRLSRLSDALVVPRHFEAAALETTGVARAVGIDLWDPTASGSNPGDNPGHMTVAVLGDGGAALSTSAKDSIRTDMENRAVAVLVVHVIDVTVTTVNLTADVHLLPGFDATATKNAIVSALQKYVDPLTWAWGGTIRRNEVISLVDQVAGVDYVINVTIAGGTGDYTLTGAATLPKAGTVTATVDGA